MSWLRPIDIWFTETILPQEGDLLRQARRWTAEDEDARDLLHEAYAQILQLTAWDQIANPAAYATRVIRNAAMQRFRRAQVVSIRHFAHLEELDYPDPAPDSFAVAAARHEYRLLIQAIATLPPAPRQVVILRKFEDLAPRVIAERMGLSLSTVEKHLARGMALLARAMKAVDDGAMPSTHRSERSIG